MPQLVDHHQAMLLARHANALNLGTADACLFQGGRCGLLECLEPLLHILLATSVGAADHVMRAGPFAQNLAADGIKHNRLGALGAAVDTKKHAHLRLFSPTGFPVFC